MNKIRAWIIGLLWLLLYLVPIIYYVNKPITDVYQVRDELEIAINDNDLDSVKKIFKKSDVNINDPRLRPQCTLASLGYVDILEYVINEGADVNITCDSYQNTPLSIAVKVNDIETAELLIQHGANVNLPSEFSNIYNAVFYIENLDMIKLLIENGANSSAKGWDGTTLLHYAVYKGNEDIFNYFIEHEGLSPLELNDDGNSIIYYAARSDNVSFFKKLVDSYGEDLLGINSLGINYLHIAALTGNEDFFNYFLENEEISPYDTDNNGNNIIHFAAECDYRGYTLFMKVFNTYTEDLVDTNNDGLNYLHIATINNNYSKVKFLIEEKNYDVNEQSTLSGDTPLMYAVSTGDKRMVEILLENNADKTITNNENKTALDISIELEYDEITVLLEE